MNEIKIYLFGVLAGVLVSVFFAIRKLLHNNGDTTDEIRDGLNDCTERTDGVEAGIERAEEAITDALDIIREVRKNKQKKDN